MELSPNTIGLIGIVFLIILLFSGISIALAMTLVGFLGMLWLSGAKAALSILGTVPFSTTATHTMSMIPLFVLMGEFAYHAGISEKVYRAVHNWTGSLRGGLAMATVVACALFAAISGSSVATAATMGSVAYPEMRKFNYAPSLATGCIAAGGTLGILIPPSITFALYGIITEQSIGRLFVAGIVPGILLTLMFLITIYLQTKMNPDIASSGAADVSFLEKIIGLKEIWIVFLLFILVIGGLYLGIFTPTEAAGMGAFITLIFAVANKQISWKTFNESLFTTAKLTAMLFFILIGAMILGYFLAVSRLPSNLASFVAGLQVSPMVVLAMVVIVYLFLGCVMDSLAMILLTVPVFFPMVMEVGFDPIWFGVIIVIVVEMGLITPPVGMNVFVLGGVVKDVPMFTIFRGVVPFIIPMLLLVVVLAIWPDIALFLPNMLYNK